MERTGTSDTSVVEFLIAAALERYQASWDQLIHRWFDRECCERVNAELEEVRKLAGALPRISADVMEVTMRHAQLLRALLRSDPPQAVSPAVTALRGKHRAAVESIRTKCLQLLTSQLSRDLPSSL